MAPTSEPHIVYGHYPDSTPEAELDALSAIYANALRKYHESKEVARPAPEPGDRDGTKTLEDSANVILPD